MRLTAIAFSLSMVAIQPTGAMSVANKTVELLAQEDGSIQIEGKCYGDVGSLRTKLLEIEARKPKPDLVLATHGGSVDYRRIGEAVLLIQRTGVFSKVGFLVEPRESRTPYILK